MDFDSYREQLGRDGGGNVCRSCVDTVTKL
jgi:hypothetical protein